MGDSLSQTFARYLSSMKFDALPAEVVDKIKASLLHALIIAMVGARTSHGRAAITLVKKEESKEDGATILVDGARATRAGAAFANSKLMHATNQTDSYRMLIHPGPCVIPAALATAELGGHSGKEL
jgi:2-methylcitrate dehydratase PrpD